MDQRQAAFTMQAGRLHLQTAIGDFDSKARATDAWSVTFDGGY